MTLDRVATGSAERSLRQGRWYEGQIERRNLRFVITPTHLVGRTEYGRRTESQGVPHVSPHLRDVGAGRRSDTADSRPGGRSL